jgi:hypothetical protein
MLNMSIDECKTRRWISVVASLCKIKFLSFAGFLTLIFSLEGAVKSVRYDKGN